MKKIDADIEDETLNPLHSGLLQQDSGMEDLVFSFMERLPSMYDEIALSHQQKNWQTLIKLIHDMKAVGGGYGFPQLTEVSHRIEQALMQDVSGVTCLIQELEVLCVRILRGANSINPGQQQA